MTPDTSQLDLIHRGHAGLPLWEVEAADGVRMRLRGEDGLGVRA